MKQLILTILLGTLLVGCQSPKARRPVSVRTGTFMEESIKRNKALYEKEKKMFETYMAQHPENQYMASSNGFWYTYNSAKSTDSITPKFGDIVTFDYNIRRLNGDTIYSKKDLKTKEYAMDQEHLFSGLREGLKLMKTGETVTFLFPSNKAFGYYGDKNKIGVNVPIVCEVTVNSITKTSN